jgi:hypothetical protein
MVNVAATRVPPDDLPVLGSVPSGEVVGVVATSSEEGLPTTVTDW